jgi:hypothetical protein
MCTNKFSRSFIGLGLARAIGLPPAQAKIIVTALKRDGSLQDTPASL